MVANNKKTTSSYVAKIVDEIGSRFPGVAVVTGIINGIAIALDNRQKSHDVLHMAKFFVGVVEFNTFIETLARKLTLGQKNIFEELMSAKFNHFRSGLEQAEKAVNWTLNEEPYNRIKSYAKKQAATLLSAIMNKEVSPYPKLTDIPLFLKILLPDNALSYQSPLAHNMLPAAPTVSSSSVSVLKTTTREAGVTNATFEQASSNSNSVILRKLAADIEELQKKFAKQKVFDNEAGTVGGSQILSYASASVSENLYVLSPRSTQKKLASVENRLNNLITEIAQLTESTNKNTDSIMGHNNYCSRNK